MPVSCAPTGTNPFHNAAARRGSSRIGVARSDWLPPPLRPSPTGGRSRVHNTRPAVHNSSNQVLA